MTTKELENYEPKGQLIGFPKEIITKMLDCQEEQGNPRDVSVFEKRISAECIYKGFDWDGTKEAGLFWDEVLKEENFDIFFKKYPKKRGNKTCSKCHKEKSVSEFHKRGDKVRSECKECRKQEYQELKTTKYVQVGDNAILSDITSTQSSVEIEINTTEDNSQEFRVGDKVYDIILGEIGIVKKIDLKEIYFYQLEVEFETSIIRYYSIGGKSFIGHKVPILLHYRDDYNYDVIDFNNLPKRQEPKRWRAEKGQRYYYIDIFFEVSSLMEEYHNTDTKLYNSGNYFQTEKEAQEVVDIIKKCFNR